MQGQWEIEGSTRTKTPAKCGFCAKPIALDQLRCKWCPFDDDAPERPWHHLECAVRSGQEGTTAPLASKTVRKKSGLSKLQLAEVSAATSAISAATPSKDASKAKEVGSGQKLKRPLQDAAEPGSKKKAKKAAEAEADGEPKAKKAKTAKAASAKAAPEAEPSVGQAKASGGARHLAGIVPSSTYKPIKDFARLVKPSGTAKQVFEREVVSAFPCMSKWGKWLSSEAQKVAGSIIKAGNNGALPPQLVYAVVLYTLDVRLGGGKLEENFYSALNLSLQQRSMKVLHKIEGYLHYLMKALEKLPAEPERVYFRGVPKSAFEIVKKNYTPGRRVHWSGMSSISEDKKVSTDFAMAEGAVKGNGPGGVVFRITARTGRKIQHLSALPAEAEVLLLPNFRGVVTKGLYRAGKVWAVDIIEEADDSGTFVF